MFSFFKKKTPITVRIREYDTPCYVAGLKTTTSRHNYKKDITKFQKEFYEKRTSLEQRSSPRGTMVIYGKPDDSGFYSYFIGDWVDTPEQSDDFIINTLEPGPYAHLTIDFKVPNDLAISVAKAKKYFFNDWLPNSDYELKGDLESIELYDRRSEIALPSIDLVFPLTEKK